MSDRTFLTGFAAALAWLILVVVSIITHITVCIKTASYGLLLIGLFFPPVGVIHGVGTWFGVF